jgi:AraC family transcriptional regulator, regulatory protein of adaptative response / methylated-DNA-[protein]-cysteine methyltransferase
MGAVAPNFDSKASAGVPSLSVKPILHHLMKRMNAMGQAAGILRYAFGETSLGSVLVVISETGVAGIMLGTDRQALVREALASFPGEVLIEDNAMPDVIAQVARLVETPSGRLGLPLDVRGTEQERAVWDALQTIPAGETQSYGAIAKSLPVPATAQEVGAACAANRIAVAIPCHRVVKADGSVSGYRWGVRRKLQLLNREAVPCVA